MFKIIANVGAWDTLYVSSLASDQLRSFLPNDVSYSRGKLAVSQERGFLVESLAVKGEGSRPRVIVLVSDCLLYTSPSPRDKRQSRMPSSA